MIDQDGLRDLVDNLTIKFDNDKANEAVQRFEILMNVYLNNPHDAPYFGREIQEWFGKDNLSSRMEKFIDELILCRYDGTTLYNHNSKSRSAVKRITQSIENFYHKVRFGHQPPIHLPIILPKQYSVKFFDSREELISICRNLVDGLFMGAPKALHANTWCEKTPASMLNLDFIHEIFPDGLFVHIHRDPRGIVNSMLSVPWSPSNVEDASHMLKQTFRKWFEVKERLSLPAGQLLEVKLEDFVTAPQEFLDSVVSTAGLSPEQLDLPEMSPDRIMSWKQKLSSSDINTINEILEEEIKLLGYDQ